MAIKKSISKSYKLELPKSRTGISGLDEITGGGLPRGRPTLVCGGPGCGKSLLSMEFLVRGATEFNEPGVFVSFEEKAEELTQNVTSLGFNLTELCKKKKLSLEYVRVVRNEIEESGEYDLEGLFVRIGYAIDSIKAKRVVLDTIETLFSGFSNEAILRSEIRRLFEFLKSKGVTAVVTGERGDGSLTRQGLEEYVSDCVILLDHRVIDQLSTRRIRIVKYRGSVHGTNEYPFLIDEKGITVIPSTSIITHHTVSEARVSTGIPALDDMMGGKGYYCGSSILITGASGTGKTTISSHYAEAACRRGEKCIYFSFEESEAQIFRNMKSVGINLEKFSRSGSLKIISSRPAYFGLEMHLATTIKQIEEFEPNVVIIDPMTSFFAIGNEIEVQMMLTRLIDFLKSKGITAIMIGLIRRDETEESNVGVSSLIDTWLLLRELETNGERNRVLNLVKSRGMAHSNQVREFVITAQGAKLENVYLGKEGFLTGSAKLSQEARDRAEDIITTQKFESLQAKFDKRKQIVSAQISALKAELESEELDLKRTLEVENVRKARMLNEEHAMAVKRKLGFGTEARKTKKPKNSR